MKRTAQRSSWQELVWIAVGEGSDEDIGMGEGWAVGEPQVGGSQ